MVDSPRGGKYRPQYWKWPQLRQRGPALLEEVHAAEEQEQYRDVTGRGVSPRWLQRLQPRQRQELCWHSQFAVLRSRQLRFSGTGTPNISEVQLLSRKSGVGETEERRTESANKVRRSSVSPTPLFRHGNSKHQ